MAGKDPKSKRYLGAVESCDIIMTGVPCARDSFQFKMRLCQIAFKAERVGNLVQLIFKKWVRTPIRASLGVWSIKNLSCLERAAFKSR